VLFIIIAKDKLQPSFIRVLFLEGFWRWWWHYIISAGNKEIFVIDDGVCGRSFSIDATFLPS
jgi:hypothetical protein